ncbi:hypothetical protein PV10_02024 [Exophiala mesophila]|uniref:Transcription factor domain-containing protein n=1 Tax=Exophiala mesophila TaxID=212818 RepID=A0A0D2A5E5_EXOME|nr:uncharacterized protein PV10_02024 [Exophiala mesophila]KIV94238.1 hypothetical protein PV10_02024 [Exophiala mesophila]
MSSGGEDRPRKNSSSSQSTGPSQPSGERRPNTIEFVDSQDPNVRSAIQRHTAYHSAAQRRDARTRYLQRPGQSRFLPWGRRPARGRSEQPTSSASSVSSLSISPVPSIERPADQSRSSSNPLDQDSQASNSRSASLPDTDTTLSVSVSTNNVRDEAVLEFCKCNTGIKLSPSRTTQLQPIHGRRSLICSLTPGATTHCQHNRRLPLLDGALAYMQEHEASRSLLLAYAYAMRWKLYSSPETVQDQVDAQANLGRGTNLLWNQLRVSGTISPDPVIQTVLLLIAYTADFGQVSEVQIHVDALRTMVAQRGGIGSFGHNSILQQQLWGIGTSRTFHITFGCEAGCTSPLRFPAGLSL